MHPVVELELALLTTSVRRSRTQLEGLLDSEFREVGASGRLWTREEIIADLVDGDEGGPIEAVQVEAYEVAPGVVLVTFLTDPGGRAARRSSLWRCAGGRWRMLHHQGTLLPTPA
jgi:hypothetical protein